VHGRTQRFALSKRCGGQQIDGPVELPKGIRCITRRGVDMEEAVDCLWSITVGDVPPIWGDLYRILANRCTASPDLADAA
jgi:hypothetical protein